jgi:tetratricopeptide (TPR) repeat protein
LRDISRSRRALARAGLILVTAFALWGILPGWAEARTDDARGQVLSDRARSLARDGHCIEALADLERARALAPLDADMLLLQGECLINTHDYVQAHEVLSDAKRIDPGLADLDLYEGVALYHIGDYAKAWDSLQAARGNVSPPGQTDLELYTGLLLLERGDEREAALALERARSLNAAQVEPVASFYAGVAWQSVGEHELARENLRRTIDLDGEDGPWGRRAAELLAGASFADRSFAGVTIGLEYDTNVTLQSQGIVLPAAISDQSDGRVVWSAYAGTELFRAGGWSGGVAASYSGNAHFHLEQFNTHYPVGTVWLDRDLTTHSFLRARYDIGYAWLDLDPYVLTQAGALEYHRNWGRFGNTELAALWEWYEFEFDPDVLAPGDPALASVRDRSGQGIGGALRHRIDIAALRNDFIKRFEANGSYTFRRYWASGDDWDYDLHELRAGFESRLPWKVDFDVWGSAGFMPFDNVSSYATPPVDALELRKDFVGQVHAEIERPINDVFSVSGRYYYLRNESNVTAFDYSRHVVGAYLNATF